jgi:hypothetical protein
LDCRRTGKKESGPSEGPRSVAAYSGRLKIRQQSASRHSEKLLNDISVIMVWLYDTTKNVRLGSGST